MTRLIVCDVLQRAVHLMLSQPTCLPKPLHSHQRKYPVPPSWVRETERRGEAGRQTDRRTDSQTDRHREKQNKWSYIYIFVPLLCVQILASSPHFCSSVCVQYNTRKRKTREFAVLPLPCIIQNANRRTKNGGGLGTRLCRYLVMELPTPSLCLASQV